uniref:FANCI_HD2 domain-containing protein n=1 Tax=Haemonchus contortus TaxID=6289 RepID=A0A7I4XVJ1_HAECO
MLASNRRSVQDEKFVVNTKVAVRQLAEERRRERVFSFLRTTVEKDQAAKVTEFYAAWCQLTSLLDEEEQDKYRYAGLRLALDVLCSQPMYTFHVSELYDQFVKQVHLCDGWQILKVLETHNETLKTLNVSSRWTDCSIVLLQHLLKNEQITKDGNMLSSTVFVRDLVYDWMLQATTYDTFGSVVSVLQNLSMDVLIEKFLDERAFEDLAIEEHRPMMTWKCINLARVVDDKRLTQILREVVAAWPKRRGAIPAAELITSVEELIKLAQNYPNVGKTCFTLFKSDTGAVMCSEFGFLLVLALCKINRYKASMIAELTKTFQKLWNFKENVHEAGCTETSGLSEIVDLVEEQVNCLVQRLGEDSQTWQLLSEATVLLLQSLLRLPSTKEVTVVDGRVADGCLIWMFASKTLVKLIMVRRKDLSSHLAMIIESVSTSSASIALIYVDMLVDIVRNCTVDVLNNWRELEGLLKCICRIPRDISVSLVRCLMPVISHRTQLREQLLLSVKGSLLDSRHADAVVPILMLLFRSFSKRPNVVLGSQMSQSFATFSSQTLQAMGYKRKTDDTVCLEVVGLLKRCLTQWTPTKMAVYLGFAEEGSRNSTMAGQCLDMLLSHATTAPDWKSETMVVTISGAVTLVEPMPQLVQAMQCLLSEEVVGDAERTQTQIGANVQKDAHELINSWVRKACSEDVHDLGIDKLSEWNPTTAKGCANLLFARMMLNLYDVLVEYVWSQFTKCHSLTAVDQIIALLGRRKELDEVLQEKNVRRKESKVGSHEGVPTLELKYADVLINGSTLTQILENTVPQEASSIEVLSEVNCELLDWAIDRALALSQSLLDGFHPLHSTLCGTSSMISLASYLLDYYTGTNCAGWIDAREISCPSKTKALEAYSNVIQYLATKYRCQPLRILPIWKRMDLVFSSTKGGEKSLTANGSLVKHCHLFMARLLPVVLGKDRGEGEQKKRVGLELERQAKVMLKICTTLMRMMDNPKCFITMFKFTMGMLEKNTVANSLTLRHLLKFLCSLALKCTDTDHTVERTLNTIADDLLQVLSEEGDECKYKFVENASQATICDFLTLYIEKSLVAVHSVITFAAAFQAKDQRMDELLAAALNKCDHCCELTSRLLPLHSQFAVERERLVQTLTTLFSAIQEPVDWMRNNVKNVPEMVEWKSLTILSELLKERLQAIMAIADEHVGIFNPEELKTTRKKSTRKDEVIYVKYVRAREALQSRVLLISEALNEDRLNFQVKKNTIGMRDFRINLNTLRTRVVQNEDEVEPRRKRKRGTHTEGRSREIENDVDLTGTAEEDDTTILGNGKENSRMSEVY